MALNSLDLKSIRKVQHVVRNPGMFPYTNLKTALAKTYRLCENDCPDKLFHNIDFGNRKPSELLHKMRYLLDAFNTSDSQSQAVIRKLFLDKLPVQVRTILAGSFDTNLDSIALRADKIIAASKSSNTTDSPRRLINEIFDQFLNHWLPLYTIRIPHHNPLDTPSMIPPLATPWDRIVDRISLEALRTVLPSTGNQHKKFLAPCSPLSCRRKRPLFLS